MAVTFICLTFYKAAMFSVNTGTATAIMDCLVGRVKSKAQSSTSEEPKPSGMQKGTLKFRDTPAQAEKLPTKCQLNATHTGEGINYY